MASGTGDQKNQLNQDNAWAKSSLSNYGSDSGNYMSNVNATLAAGNPYQSTQYKTNQNLETSGAMNAANTRQQQQMGDVARRTGSNTAAMGDSLASSARQGQRDLTGYNALRDTGNQDKWLVQQRALMGDQLAGANSEAQVYGTQMHGADAALGDLTSRQNTTDQMWADMAKSTAQAAGAAAAA